MPERFDLLDMDGVRTLLAPPLILSEIDGIGMPEIAHFIQRAAQMHGEMYVDTWLRRRVVTFGLTLQNVCEAEVWDMRDKLLTLMVDFSRGFMLRAWMPNFTKRQILLRYFAGLTLPRSMGMPSNQQTFAFQAVALDDPTWYDPDLRTAFWTIAAGAGAWEYDLGFPEGFGSGVISAPATLHTSGNWRTYPIIQIGGPCDTIEINNTSTGEKLEFAAAYAITAGEIITIDLTPGVKTVVHSVDGNIVDQLSDDSDLGTFHLGVPPEVANGDNVFTVSVANASAATWVSVAYYDKYIGI